MLDRVVEHERLPYAPFPNALADPETAAGRNDQWQVRDKPDVGHARMWRDARPWRE